MSDEGAWDDLISRAVGGDSIALKVLLAESRTRLCRYLEMKIPPELARLIDADDIVQEAHVEVFRRIGGFRPQGPDSFFRWVTAIAVSRLRNAFRRQRTIKRGGGDVPVGQFSGGPGESAFALFDVLSGSHGTPSRFVARREAIELMENAIQKLPERHRLAVSLVYIEGQRVADVASRLGCTERAIHGLCRRGLVMLAGYLGHRSGYLTWVG